MLVVCFWRLGTALRPSTGTPPPARSPLETASSRSDSGGSGTWMAPTSPSPTRAGGRSPTT
eukprot:7537674-Alexandrium_andersonii.AAC.1